MACRVANFLLAKANYQIVNIPKPSFINAKVRYHRYDQDSLYTIHNHDFLEAPKFIGAYQRGMQAQGEDAQIHWRVHVALWVAENCNRLEGDFVECGVNKGIFSSCIMQYLNWNSLKKHFFLFDTFQGIDPKYLNEREQELGRIDMNGATAKVAAAAYFWPKMSRGAMALLDDYAYVG
jgi:hypothetical protein